MIWESAEIIFSVILLFPLPFIIMLVFVHGMWCDGSIWKNFVEHFEDRGFKCIAPDLNEGLDLRKTRFEDYVAKIENMVGEEDVIIGHSMGGLIVQKVAERKKIKGGVALCPAPPKGIKFSNSSIIFQSMKFLPKIILKKPFKPDVKFTRNFLANCIDEGKVKKIYPYLKKFPPLPAYEVAMGKIAVDEKKIKSPLLFIATKNDRASPSGMVKKIAEKYNAEFVLKEGCHWIFDDWKEIAEEISAFLLKLYSD